MVALSLILSIIALIVAVAAFYSARGGFAAGGGGFGAARGPGDAPPVAVDYTITGSVKVTNDCDGQIGSIPNRVTVETELQDQTGRIAVPGRTTIDLAPDPNAGGNPIKLGTYSITVRWLPGTTVAPVRWLDPKVVDQPFGTPICAVIRCPVDGPCRDIVPAANVPFADPTAHDIEVVCTCT